MRYITHSLLIAFAITVFGCTEKWDDHYNTQPETINTNVWDAIKADSDLSSFVTLMEKYQYDTLFISDDTYTLFVPNNDAMANLVNSQVSDTTILNYHISRHFVQPVDIQGKRKLQTLAEKYSTFERVEGNPTFDGISMTYESPLYINGKFFTMNQVAIPRLNLYEFFAKNNPYLKTYIDSKDTSILDREKSRPIGFDANGNTVFDTVSIKANLFEMAYFPVSMEFRKWTATFVYPKLATYQSGLNGMAQKLGGTFTDYTSVPYQWQKDILIPYLLKHGTFLNMLDKSEFKVGTGINKSRKFNMVNIQGDSILVNYTPTDPYLCSNGIYYDYTNFVIPDSLFSGVEKFEGEWLARKVGSLYKWRDSVTVISDASFDVVNSFIGANDSISNDSISTVKFTKGYKGKFSLEFNAQNMFPGNYRMVVNTFMDIGGQYNIYVNDVLVKYFDYYDYVRARGIINSVVKGVKFAPYGRYNKFDCYVNNIITSYGKPKIRFEYVGPGLAPANGLVIDVIKFIPTTKL